MGGGDGGEMIGATEQERAYIGPFLGFVALFALGSATHRFFEGQAVWWAATPEYWLYPLQTIVAAALLYRWRAHYRLLPVRRASWTMAIGLVALAVWIAPQVLLHRPPRVDGFDPGHLGTGVPYAFQLALRLVRMVVVVPIVEELFWRGFLLRYCIDENFSKVPVGAYSRWSFWIVSVGFGLEHEMADWPAALATGMLFNLVAYRTGCLGSCILAHAVTNAALSGYILYTRQWGFW